MLDAPTRTTLGLAAEAPPPASLAGAPGPATATSALALATRFLARHGHGLAAAAEALGGQRAFGRWCRQVGDLRYGRLTPRQVERELTHLLALLRLEHVSDPEREEAGRFVLLHPDSPAVHEMCLLTEALEAVLVDMRELTRRQEAARTLPVCVVQAGPGKRAREVMPHSWRSAPASRIRAARHAREEGVVAEGTAAATRHSVAPTRRPAAA